MFIKVNPYSAGIDFRRQNWTSIDVRFWRLKKIMCVLYLLTTPQPASISEA